jgi:ABC-type lipoprotein release transport system permease subunit
MRVALGLLLMGAVVSALPARRAGRMPVAVILRSE